MSTPEIRAQNYLPAACQDDLWAALFGALNDQAAVLQQLLDPEIFAERYLNPDTSTALDYRANMSLVRDYWSVDWPETAKRNILKNQVWLANNRYNPLITMPRLFEWFGLDATIQPIGGFVLGEPIPEFLAAGRMGANQDSGAKALGVNPDSGIQRIQIRVPPSYTPGSYEMTAINEIVAIMGLPFEIPIKPRQ